MTGEQRVLLAREMSLFVQQLQESRPRQQHPQWSDAEVGRKLLGQAFQSKGTPRTVITPRNQGAIDSESILRFNIFTSSRPSISRPSCE